MAGGARALKRRIKVVKNTQQITNAMKMVAAAKLKVAQAKIEAAAPYTDKMQEILNRLLQGTDKLSHPLTVEKEGNNRLALVIFTSDRGLCGSFNSNLIRKGQTFVDSLLKEGKQVSLMAVGERGYAYFSKRKYRVIASHTGLEPKIRFQDCKRIGDRIKELYTEDDFDSVHICYPKFKNTMTVIPTVIPFLPLAAEISPSNESDTDYIFEPEVEKLYNSLIPRYVDMQLFRLLIESMTSEYATRMTAMTAATDNADEVIDNLTITYNKMRQSAITSELLDIVGGANALSG
ncbi:MAG: ATP synthase F1 subunit gamma [Candidatus Cloacimonetes bacterium 4572_55]|nr:MAG: ATP synthase F1 subunit gamma [Candidatus Cloacimonetes bacterium 4572_55]